MILHLLRKFTEPTETFVVNQINATQTLRPKVFTIRNLANLAVEAEVISASESTLLSSKFLSGRSLSFFNSKLNHDSPDLIHTHYLTDARFFHPFTKNVQVPKVCSCYGYDVSDFPKKFGWLSRKYFQPVFREYKYFLAMSEIMKADLLALGCPGEKILVHYHGIDTRRFDIERTYKLGNGLNLLTIARLHPMKGHLTVLKALLLIKNKIPLIRYNIVGDGPNEHHLKRFVKESGLNGIVFFHNAVTHGSDFNKYLKEADVFIHPSEITQQGAKEGIPGAIVEAMASGLPVIATFHGGIPSVISDSFTGLLINEQDSSSLAEQILLLYRDEVFRRRIGENAKKYAQEHLDLHYKAKQLEEVYLSLTEKSLNGLFAGSSDC